MHMIWVGEIRVRFRFRFRLVKVYPFLEIIDAQSTKQQSPMYKRKYFQIINKDE